MVPLRDDDVIDNAKTENLGGFGQLGLQAEVGLAGLRVAAGVVVDEDDAGGAVGDHVCENFARMDGAVVEQADGDHALFDHLVRAV